MRKTGCLGVIVLLLLAFWARHDWKGAGPAEQPVAVVVPAGAGLSRTANELEMAGAIRSAFRFRLFARLTGGAGSIKAGEYAVPAGASASDVLALLTSGKVRQQMVVVPEGYPSVLVHDALMKADGLEGAVPVPAVNETALAGVGLWAKTEAGPASSPLKITDRDFGWAAARTPKLSPDVVDTVYCVPSVSPSTVVWSALTVEVSCQLVPSADVTVTVSPSLTFRPGAAAARPQAVTSRCSSRA